MIRRRFASLLLLSLLLQVTLAAQGNHCVTSSAVGVAMSSSGNSDMPGMPMPAPGPKPSSGNHPTAPAACQPMASCASVVVQYASVARPDTIRSPRIAALVALAPDSRSTRPELPPPRV